MPRHVHQGSYAHAWGLKTADGCKESDLGITLCHSSHTWSIFFKIMVISTRSAQSPVSKDFGAHPVPTFGAPGFFLGCGVRERMMVYLSPAELSPLPFYVVRSQNSFIVVFQTDF